MFAWPQQCWKSYTNGSNIRLVNNDQHCCVRLHDAYENNRPVGSKLTVESFCFDSGCFSKDF